jgi:hypothetical protein
MTRTSSDEYRSGHVYNGYSYIAQAWVVDGIVQGCEHPESMRTAYSHCCSAHRYAGKGIAAVEDVIMLAAGLE